MRVQYEVGADTNGTGKLIYTDQPQAWLKYVSRVSDVNMFDAIFMEALAWRLAAAINMALTGNADLGTFALNMYNRVILSAGSHSQNESQEPQPPVDEFTIARLDRRCTVVSTWRSTRWHCASAITLSCGSMAALRIDLVRVLSVPPNTQIGNAA